MQAKTQRARGLSPAQLRMLDILKRTGGQIQVLDYRYFPRTAGVLWHRGLVDMDWSGRFLVVRLKCDSTLSIEAHGAAKSDPQTDANAGSSVPEPAPEPALTT